MAAVLGVFCFGYGLAFGIFAPARMVQFFFPVLLLAGLTIWAMPHLGKAPTAMMERLFFVFFITLPLWPNYLAVALPGLPWITIMRIVGFPLVFMLLLSLSISPAFRAELKRIIEAIPLLWKAIALFSVYQALSVALSDSPQVSLNKLLVSEVNWTAIFFISAYVFARKGRVETWATLLWGAAVILSIMGVEELRERKVLWAGHIPSFLAIEDPSVQRVLTGRMRAGTDQYRVLATFSTALGFSEFLALVTPFVLHFMLGPFRLVVRIAAAISLPIILNAIVMTDSRLGMVGFLMSCMLYVLFWGALRWRQNRGSIIGPAVVLAYPALALAFMGAVLTVQRLRVMTLGGGKHQASNEARVEQVQMGLPMVFKHPFGHGIGRGAEALGFTSPGGGLTIDTYWLLIALEYGIIGFVVFFGIFVVATLNGFRTVVTGIREREEMMLVPLIIALFCYVVIKSIYAGVENQSTVFMMLGAIMALVYRAKTAQARAPASGIEAAPRTRRFRTAGIA